MPFFGFSENAIRFLAELSRNNDQAWFEAHREYESALVGYLVGGESYKKTPRGVPADHPRAALAKHGGLFASLEGEHPQELGSPSFVDHAFMHFSRTSKLYAWLVGLRG